MIENSTETKLNAVRSAMAAEKMTNPGCPVANDILSDLITRYQQGDMTALDFAYDIALDSLRPRKSLRETIQKAVADIFVRIR